MAFLKKDHLIGLDIGSSIIKVAEFDTKGKDLSLKNFAFTSIPPESIIEGNINDAEGVADAIRTLLKKHKIKEKNVAISTGGYSVVVKTINVPTASEEELQNSIRFEAEQYIPYDIDDVNIDFQILGTSEFSPDQMDVLLVAVRKELVEEYINMLHLAGLNPCIIDVDTFAFQNIYEVVTDTHEDEVSLLIDVGLSKTSLNIIKGFSSLMMRDNSSGTLQIREEIMSRTNCTPIQAENVIKGIDKSIMEESEVKEISLQIAQQWSSEIFSVVNTYSSKFNGGKIGKIVLCGGGAYIDGFARYIGLKTEAEVQVFNPFKGISVDEKRFPASMLEKIAPLAPIALGLALRKVNDK